MLDKFDEIILKVNILMLRFMICLWVDRVGIILGFVN